MPASNCGRGFAFTERKRTVELGIAEPRRKTHDVGLEAAALSKWKKGDPKK
jgi:hypothetical protein